MKKALLMTLILCTGLGLNSVADETYSNAEARVNEKFKLFKPGMENHLNILRAQQKLLWLSLK